MPEDIKITMLGTSAAIPSSSRNPTSILLQYKDENILIDCAEGTQRQMRKAKLNPMKINKILITHWHGDHVLGMPPLFQTMVLMDYNKEMNIFGPKKSKEFLKSFIEVFAPVFNFKAKTHEVAKPGIFFENKEFYLEAEKMQHGIPANAYNFVIKDKIRIDKKALKKSKLPSGKHLTPLLKGKDITYNDKKFKAKDLTYVDKGKKISIVLDTLYNEKIIPFVKNADLLIIESSFSNEFKELAKDHLHLTALQDGKIAKKAKVKKLVLTHISQRNEHNTKPLLKEAQESFKNTHVAKDFDTFKV